MTASPTRSELMLKCYDAESAGDVKEWVRATRRLFEYYPSGKAIIVSPEFYRSLANEAKIGEAVGFDVTQYAGKVTFQHMPIVARAGHAG